MIRKRDRYKFLLKCGDVEHVATPIYNGLKKVWEQESGEIFFRYRLEGTLKFVGKDYAFVRGCDFAKQIDVEIYKTTDNTEELYWKGYFRKTDCETDINHGMITVKPKPNDKYKLIMDKLSEEYNLVKHNPKMSNVSMTVRPMLQVYELGADYVNNYIGSAYHKAKVTPIYGGPDEELNFSAKTSMHCSITQCIDSFEYKDDIIGNYVSLRNWQTFNDSSATAYFAIAKDDNEAYRVLIDRYYTAYPESLEVAEIKLQVYTGDYTETDIQLSDQWQTIASYYDNANNRAWIPFADLKTIESNIPMYWNGNLLFEIEKYKIMMVYYRMLYRDENQASNIVEEDGFVASEIYNRTKAIDPYNFIHYSTYLSEDITRWGLDEDSGKYYIPVKEGLEMGGYEPLLSESWGNGVSYWVDVYSYTRILEERYSTSKTLKDWYSLYEVIRVLLKAIDPNVTVSHGSASSMFLWSNTNPITGMANQGEMFLLQKSNATKLEYDYSASKAEIKLKQIFDWLKTFNVYWDVVEYPDGRLVLRIEHKLFYMNGESYNSNNITNIDLRNIHDTRNGKDYAYLTGNWKYEDVNNVATKIYYKWMDEVSLPFEGEAMTAVDNPYGEEHQETRTAEAFTSDIDYIFANSETVSKDGFVVVQGYKGEGEQAYAIHFYDTTINGRQYHLQNGLLSVAYMQRYYMPYDMPSRQMTITGGDVIDVIRTKQLRQNEVKFALPKGMEINDYTTLTTEAGVGTIARMEQDLSTEIYTTTLKYDNEQ
jgi:hypothetical protein